MRITLKGKQYSPNIFCWFMQQINPAQSHCQLIAACMSEPFILTSMGEPFMLTSMGEPFMFTSMGEPFMLTSMGESVVLTCMGEPLMLIRKLPACALMVFKLIRHPENHFTVVNGASLRKKRNCILFSNIAKYIKLSLVK